MNNDVYSIAKTLCPDPVEAVVELDKGGNSRIYKVLTKGCTYALKRYPKSTATDTRDRLYTEALALKIMRQYGTRNIPEVIASDAEKSYSLLSWIAGDTITEITDNDITSFAGFLARLADISTVIPRQNLPYASEACVKGSAIVKQIEQRLDKLVQATLKEPELKQFLSHQLIPYLEFAKDRAQDFYSRHGWTFDGEVAQTIQVLIPSDFGAHNALRYNNTLVFLDFEYFGWDDSVTSTANFILHPAMSLSERQKQQFQTLMEPVFSKHDPLYADRLEALLPLYIVRWCSIILGEFIPERFAHRIQSGQYRPEDKPLILQRQLEKAKALIHMEMA